MCFLGVVAQIQPFYWRFAKLEDFLAALFKEKMIEFEPFSDAFQTDSTKIKAIF